MKKHLMGARNGFAMGYREIGDEMGIPRATVWTIEARALKKIRKMDTPAARRFRWFYGISEDK
jgi:DNA-directed RNA polymerase specialized sigma24 family protein